AAMAGQPIPLSGRPGIGFDEARALLSTHTAELLGPRPVGRDTRIMVTVPTEAATDPELLQRLLEAGMDVMRVNLAHDDQATWSEMLRHRRDAEKPSGRTCRVLMDLAGPKLRTGPLEPGPRVLRIRPRLDELGRVTQPAYVWLTGAREPSAPRAEEATTLTVPRGFLKAIDVDGAVRFEDARGRRREMTIVNRSADGALAVLERTAFIVPGIELRVQRHAGERARIREEDVPALEGSIRVRLGDLLLLRRDLSPGRPPLLNEGGSVTSPAVIGCTLPEVFRGMKVGEPVWFDDGKIGGVAEDVGSDEIAVRVVRTRPNGSKLRGGRGINVPETDLPGLQALTPDDDSLLPFVVEHADLIGLSFVRSGEDIDALERRLEELGGEDLGILAKIETVAGFRNLPEILLELMRWPFSGVMIARGDLAVEGGYRRLAEVQEEILWLCEAAHLPAVWATQVLEGMAKTGTPSRAEITDAAMSTRAECVMLNKGPFIEDAIRTLDDILRRMREHQRKKQSRLRRLRSWYAQWPDAQS
ncbi:MAG: pyruvate kinase, partial [Acidimicrobiia bacterium]